MDILAHGLWAGAVAKIANRKLKKPINVWWIVWWGIFPDFTPFFIPFFVGGWALISGKLPVTSILYRVGLHESWYKSNGLVFNLTHDIYAITHSLIVFAAVFLIVYLFLKRPVWELSGWFLHILIDIPTHTTQFFPTPAFWPVSNWTFNGIGWAQFWFLIPNYLAIIIVYIILALKKKNKNKV